MKDYPFQYIAKARQKSETTEQREERLAREKDIRRKARNKRKKNGQTKRHI